MKDVILSKLYVEDFGGECLYLRMRWIKIPGPFKNTDIIDGGIAFRKDQSPESFIETLEGLIQMVKSLCSEEK